MLEISHLHFVSAGYPSKPREGLRLRVAYFIDGLRPGGKERQAVSLLNGLAQHGVEITLVCMGADRFFDECLPSGSINIENLVRWRRWDFSLFIRLDRLLRKYQPDLLHTTCWMTSFYVLPLAKLRRIPVMNGSIRNAFTCEDGNIRWRIERLLLRLSDCRIANSRAGFLSRGLNPDAPGNYTVHNGFDFSRLASLDHGPARNALVLAQRKRIVGMVAQFKDDKDYRTFFEAARLILQNRSDVVFVAIGDGRNLDTLRQQYGGNPDIFFLGRRSEVERFICHFEIGVLATYTEGISNALMEYMALSKPVVATDGGGTAELVVDGVTGFIIPPRQPQALAEKIEFLLNNRDLASALGRAGLQRLRDQFSLQQLVAGTMECYESVLGPHCNSTTSTLDPHVDSLPRPRL